MANAGRLILPKNLTPVARDIVKRILVPDPEVRMEIRDIMKHKFFEGVDWNTVERRTLEPPYVPPEFDLHNLMPPESVSTSLDIAMVSEEVTSMLEH